jgi:hydrogenase assembly chaperone HypC/HupF
MCVAYPARVLAVHGDGCATVDVLGRQQDALLVFLVDDGRPVAEGDWLLVQTGLALARLDETEAAERIALMTAATALAESTGRTDTIGGTT